MSTITTTLTDEQALAQLSESSYQEYFLYRDCGYTPQRTLRAILQSKAYEHRASARAGLPDYDEEVIEG